MSENANETVFLTSEVEAKAGVVNCCDTAKWYGKDMTPEEKAELKKQQREFDKSRLKKWLDQNALSAGADEDTVNEAEKMHDYLTQISAMVRITAEDVDLILFEALNAGGISDWSDAVKTVGDKLGKRVCEQISLGGELMIHEIDGEWYTLTKQKLLDGIKKYMNESCHIRIEDQRIVGSDLTPIDADIIVQFALFGEADR